MFRFFLKSLIAYVFTLSVIYADGVAGLALIENVTPISMADAEKMLDNNEALFMDVNNEETHKELGYIPRAVFIDTQDWEKLLPKDKNAYIIFYSRNRLSYESSEAALIAQTKGYKNVYVMLDGIEGWILSGRKSLKQGAQEWNQATGVIDFVDGIHKDLVFGSIPSCRDCHGNIKSASDIRITKKGIDVNTANNRHLINKNCASCHEDVDKDFTKSVHSKKLANIDFKEYLGLNNKTDDGRVLPTCADCHFVHTTTQKGLMNPKQLNDLKCGACHSEKQIRYQETFHGKAMALNIPGTAPRVAACYDCHGTHNIHKVSNPESTLYGENRIQTCAQCHPGATANFAEYIAHANHYDKDNYPALYWVFIFMTCLVIVVFVFFGFHTFLWSARLIMVRLKYPKQWKEAREAAHNNNIHIRRFNKFHRIQHFFMASSFLGLAFSGLPQKFYNAPWAEMMIKIMGGPLMATTIHHISAVIMFCVFFSHIGEIVYRAWLGRDSIRDPQSGKLSFKLFMKALFGPDSLMPRGQDFKDMAAHFKWFFGKGERPQFDRWTYWEKFDYLAVFWGMFVIGFSGLMLWFPVAFSHILPGISLNVATIIHSDEALLATGFIFAVHFFNTHFRADRFPMDMVIFSGSITEEEMKQERIKWYDRLKNSGRLEKLLDKAYNFKPYYKFARFVGFAMLTTGIFFLFLMIYAFVHSVFFS